MTLINTMWKWKTNSQGVSNKGRKVTVAVICRITAPISSRISFSVFVVGLLKIWKLETSFQTDKNNTCIQYMHNTNSGENSPLPVFFCVASVIFHIKLPSFQYFIGICTFDHNNKFLQHHLYKPFYKKTVNNNCLIL